MRYKQIEAKKMEPLNSYNISDNAMKELACEVILQAAKDFYNTTTNAKNVHYKEICNFFENKHKNHYANYEYWAVLAGIDISGPEILRQLNLNIKNGITKLDYSMGWH